MEIMPEDNILNEIENIIEGNKKEIKKLNSEKIHTEKLTRSQKNYVGNCERLYYYFCDLYNTWQYSGSDIFPDLVFVHTSKEKDEIDVNKDNTIF